jgi:putative tributyrin esterase
MAIFQVTFQSYTLRMNTSLVVIIPSSKGWDRFNGTERHTDFLEKFPCLYLLHGFSGDCMSWLSGTGVEEYAQKYQVAMVMPSGCNSAFTDMKYGLPYSTFLWDELPEFVQRMFPVSSAVEDTYIAGFSMGGYGALMNGINHPERYGGAISFSGTLNVDARLMGQTNSPQSLTCGIYGDPPAIDRSTQDIFVMLENASRTGALLPRLFACCGTEDDRAYPRYLMLKECCEKNKIPITLEEGPGVHEYRFCDRWMPRILEWMLEKK